MSDKWKFRMSWAQRQRLEFIAMNCEWCDELVTEDEGANLIHSPTGMKQIHAECMIRSVMGSVGHIQGRCCCFVPGSVEDDPPGMTIREAAKAAREALTLRVMEENQVPGLSCPALEWRMGSCARSAIPRSRHKNIF